VILRSAVLVEHRLVTDGRTDGQTDGHRAMASTADAQHRAVKINDSNFVLWPSTSGHLHSVGLYTATINRPYMKLEI